MSLGVHKLTFFHTNQSQGLILFNKTIQNTSRLVKYSPFSHRCQFYFFSIWNSCTFDVYDLLFGKNIEPLCLKGLSVTSRLANRATKKKVPCSFGGFCYPWWVWDENRVTSTNQKFHETVWNFKCFFPRSCYPLLLCFEHPRAAFSLSLKYETGWNHDLRCREIAHCIFVIR